MQKWEYCFQNLSDRDEVRVMGRDGWELVAVFEQYGEPVGAFKRPL